MFHTTIGAIHTLFAVLALISGAVVVLRKKGDGWHKKVGYFYVVVMLTMNITALFTQSLFVFGPFHFLALFSLFTIIFGMWWPLFLRHRKRWLHWHFQAMSWSYVGLWAAFFAEIAVRLPFVEFGIGFALMVVLATLLVTVTGGYFIVNYQKKLKDHQR